MGRSKKAGDIAAYEIERLRKNASQKREQRQRASAAQKAVHALQEQQRRQRASAAQKEMGRMPKSKKAAEDIAAYEIEPHTFLYES